MTAAGGREQFNPETGPALRSFNAFFGDAWPSGVCEGGRQVPTPVGEPCSSCDDPITEGDQGSFIGNGVWPDRPALVPRHRECALRDALGGIGHHEDHQRWCVIEGDPDGGRSRRRSSIEVWTLFNPGEPGGS